MEKKVFLKTFLILFCILFLFFLGKIEKIKAQPIELSQDIAIAAIVQIWLDFRISTTTLELLPPLVAADGTLNVGSSTEVILSLGTNNSRGWDMVIKSLNNGLHSLAANYTISSSAQVSNLVAGTEGYGANATSVFSGVSIGEIYDYYGSDTVGELVNQYNVLAFYNNQHLMTEVVKLQIKAAASLMTPSGYDYQDTIIITITPRI